MKKLGMRVLRGPDWDQNASDGGEGHLGTVVGFKAEEGTAEVVWDNGQVTTCRVGKEGKHDLRIYDNATAGECLSRGVVCQGCRNSSIYGTSWRCSTCSNLHLCSRCYHLGVHPLSHQFLRQDDQKQQSTAVGTRSGASRISVFGIFPEAKVTRGHDWKYGNTDGGPDGSGVVVEVVSPESGSARNAVRVSWDSGQSLQHRLGLHGKVDLVCTEEAPGPACYVSHLPVLALIQSGAEEQATECASEQGQIREDSNTGTTRGKDELNAAGVTAAEVDVKTDIGQNSSSVSTADAIGNRDEVVKEQTLGGSAGEGVKHNTPGVTGTGQVTAQDSKRNEESSMTLTNETRLKSGSGKAGRKTTPEILNDTDGWIGPDTEGEIGVGDRVEVGVDFDIFRDIQSQTASWNDNMVECLGRTGVVKSFTARGEMEVDFEGQTCNISPICLMKATVGEANSQRIKEGDTVRIISDTKILEELQQDHGGWNASMKEAAGKVGKVKKVTPRGDVEVSLGQQSWVFNPQSCRPAPGCPTHLHSEDPMNGLLEALLSQESSGVETLVTAVRAGNIRAVEAMLERDPGLVRGRSSGATPLHHAAYTGQTEAVRLLVARGSDINVGDSDNDTPLSLTVHDDHTETARVLIELGADIGRANFKGATTLHLAIARSCTGIVLLLLQHKASVNCQDSDSNTPLYIAVMKGADDIIMDSILAVDDLDLSIPNKQRATPLHMAVFTNRTRNVERILARDSSIVDQRMEKGTTALHLASQGKTADITRLLLGAGAGVNLTDDKGKTPLHMACVGDHADLARILVENGANLNEMDEDRNTPLHLCVGAFTKWDQVPTDKGLELSKYLIERGARTDIRNARGNTIVEGTPTAVKEKLKHFIRSRERRLTKNLNADDDLDVSNVASSSAAVTGRCITCQRREADVIFLPCAHKLLCRECAGSARTCRECGLVVEGKIDTDGNPVAPLPVPSNDPNDRESEEFQNPPSAASKRAQSNDSDTEETPVSEPSVTRMLTLFRAISNGNTIAASTMVKEFSSLVQETHEGETALHYASMLGQTEIVRLLVAKGAQVNKGDIDEDTPLARSILESKTDTAKALIELGADVNYVNARAESPLHIAVGVGSSDIVRLLIQHRASTNLRDSDGDTPLLCALMKSTYNPDIVDALLTVKDLDFKVTTPQNATVLHLAVHMNRTRVVEEILARDSSLVNLTLDDQRTVLHLATQDSHIEILKLLIRANARIDAKEDKGRTPLHLACPGDEIACVRILVDSGADVNATDNNLNTPLHFAIGYQVGKEDPCLKHKGLELAKFLIQHGARIDMKNVNGETPLSSASGALRDELELYLRARDGSSSKDLNVGDKMDVSATRAQPTVTFPKCVSCGQREPDVIFLPCAHKLLCRQCAGSANACRECGCVIEGRIDVEGNPVGQTESPCNDMNNEQSAGETSTLRDTNATLNGPASSEIRVGDAVRVSVDEETFRIIQAQRSSWSSDMTKCLGKTGIVKRVAQNGEVAVDFSDRIWLIHSVALTKGGEMPKKRAEMQFKVGDTVRIISDLRLLEEQQKDYGGFNPRMALAAGKVGRVARVFFGHVMVQFGQNYWTFNPRNCQPAPGCPTDFIPGMHKDVTELLTGEFAQLMNSSHDFTSGTPSLMRAYQLVTKADSTAVRRLIEKDPGVVHESVKGVTPLHYACSLGRTDIVRLLLDKDSNLNTGDSDDDSPLHKAIQGAHAETARVLIEFGADVNRPNKKRLTPLHAAVVTDSVAILRLLLQHKPSVNEQDMLGNTPLLVALKRETTSHSIVEALIATGNVDLTLANKEGLNALHMATHKKNARAVQQIVSRDPSTVHTKTPKGNLMALHLATYTEQLEIMRILIAAGAFTDGVCYTGQTALHLACAQALLESATVLLENGANVNAFDNDGDTPLHFCVADSTQMIQRMLGLPLEDNDKKLQLAIFLIRHGGRPDARNKKGKTPLDVAKGAMKERLARFLRDNDVGNSKSNQTAKLTNATSVPVNDTTKCVTCHQREADVIFLPCAHKLLCRQCAGSARSCQECGNVVEGKIDTDGNPVVQAADGADHNDVTEEQECKVQ